MKKNNQLFI